MLVLTVVYKINPCNSKSHREILLELLGLLLRTQYFFPSCNTLTRIILCMRKISIIDRKFPS